MFSTIAVCDDWKTNVLTSCGGIVALKSHANDLAIKEWTQERKKLSTCP